MKKIIVEIDGQRHRLVEDKSDATCDKCSLRGICVATSAVCIALGNYFCHFEKEEEVCG